MDALTTDEPARSEAPARSEDLLTGADPFALFGEWLAAAEASEPNDPNAMALATVDRDGMPDVRMVLLKGWDRAGFVFYTNTESAKGAELADNPRAAIVLHWKSQRRQVRVRGPVSRVTAGEADAYFATRSRDSRLGAWASRQSRPIADRSELLDAFRSFSDKHALEDVPRPPHWLGFRITPEAIEFWNDRPHRLHDRVRFTRSEGGWAGTRLFP